ncbi:MAG: DGQHR domain-containing protein, partial [Candidatus Methanofastidiosa archaeon]|nr:DGQHR domain-containing protein [Candidatus Methanofastidiosa archaeon]
NVSKENVDQYFKDGWEKVSINKSSGNIRIKKRKDIGTAFEDRVWCIFKKLGFLEMNGRNDFCITRHGSIIEKQIDVFAKEEQCICIVECKSSEEKSKNRNLGLAIDQIGSIKRDLEASIFSHYKNLGNVDKIKIVWILALENIELNENDAERARLASIKVLDNKQIDYYEALSDHFGPSAKYQFLADLLPGIEIPSLIEPIPAIRGTMGKYTFYSFLMEHEKLLKISYIAHRANKDLDSLHTYQRMAKKQRLKKIDDYIQNQDGIFPTSIVLNIESDRPIRFDVSEKTCNKNAALGTLYIPNNYKTAWIIDGQHRLFAYSGLPQSQTATLPVIAFENLEPDVQANLFVDINGEQVKVPKGHLIDMWDTLHWNSKNPSERLKALTSKLAKELGEFPTSPLKDRIVQIDARRTDKKNITITHIVEEIRKEKILGRVESRKSKNIIPGPLYSEDLDTTLIKSRDIIINYLNNYINYSDNIKTQWNLGSGEGGYIGTNQGLVALLRVLSKILEHLEFVDRLDVRTMNKNDLTNAIFKYQKPVCEFFSTAPDKQIREFRSQYGEAGFSACTNYLLNEIYKQNPKFLPTGLKEWIKNTNSVNNKPAYDLICDIERGLLEYIVEKLKEEFGQDITEWWHKGFPEIVKKPALARAHENGEYNHYEKYVDLIDWESVIISNFDLLGDTFTIDGKTSDSKKKRIAWISQV